MSEPSLKRRRGAPNRVLVVGVPRSGTSWLGNAMGRARGARFYYEPDDINATRTATRSDDGLGFGPYPIIDEGQDDNQFTPVWDMVFSGRAPIVYRRPQVIAARALLRLPTSVRDPLLRRAAALAARMPSRHTSTIAKTVYATFSLEWLVARYQPLVVAIQRNPLNVVSSWRELHIPVFDLASRPLIRERYLEPLGIDPPPVDASELSRIAWHVGLLTQVLGDAVDRHPEWRRVTHEDLCLEPTSSIRDIFDGLGLVWTDEVDRYLSKSNRPGEGLHPVRVTSQQPNRWRERLTDSDVEEVQTVLDRFPRRGWVYTQAPLAS